MTGRQGNNWRDIYGALPPRHMFAAASDQLTNITGHTTDLTTQLATENNAAVLAYIQLKAQRTSSDADLFKWKFENCLQNCAVCRVFHPRKTKLNYDCDEKSACVGLIRQCLKAIEVASGFASYKLGQYTEGISTLMEIVRSQPPATPRLRARVHFLIGLCFAKLTCPVAVFQDKRPLGLAMFREAMCADFSFLRPLYTTALQYSSFGDNDMELECLNLLTMMRDSPGLQVTSGVDVLSLVDFEDEDITYPTALYTLASRALKLHKRKSLIMNEIGGVKRLASILQDQPVIMLFNFKLFHVKFYFVCLCRFDVAAEKYTILLQHLRTGTVQLCDHALACYHGNTVSMDTTYDPSQGSSHSGEFTDELPRAEDVIDFVYNKRVVNKKFSQNSKNNEDLSNNGEEMETSCSGQSLKRKYSEDRASECHHGDTDVVALKFKALALHKIGKIEDALICLKRQKMRAVMGSSSEPQSKRRKIQEPGANGKKMSDTDSTLRDDNSIEKLNVTKGSSAKLNSGENKLAGLHGTSLELECELYEMTSNILDSLKKSKDAAHFRRLSTELKSCFKNVFEYSLYEWMRKTRFCVFFLMKLPCNFHKGKYIR
ncbi:LOW QUALITY PROTEIN: hypothetical protein MAR_017008 [Mya arenaria]|uniref:Uncharacterized protein n=1 Tax=Mya arenaria TaxID=6604 RepID=A0ABY7EB21_MYAAR|nr:LOW QUALITY PROTEIN: hypothetical protein MAR_017008 [Mya arenaria]